MNERINELIKSTNYWYAETNSKADWRLLNGVGEMEWNQKFAQLIVRECIEIADEYDGAGSTIVDRIEKHFGVEE